MHEIRKIRRRLSVAVLLESAGQSTVLEENPNVNLTLFNGEVLLYPLGQTSRDVRASEVSTAQLLVGEKASVSVD